MLPKYSSIFAHKSHCACFLHGVFGNPSCYFVYDLINTNSLYQARATFFGLRAEISQINDKNSFTCQPKFVRTYYLTSLKVYVKSLEARKG